MGASRRCTRGSTGASCRAASGTRRTSSRLGASRDRPRRRQPLPVRARRGRSRRPPTSTSSRTSTSAGRRWCARRPRTTPASPSSAIRPTTRACSPRSSSTGTPTHGTRAELAAKAFAHTAAYDAAISGYLSSREPDGASRPLSRAISRCRSSGRTACATARTRTRRGPSTSSASAEAGSLARAESLGAGGKELSFNNLVDVDAALDAVREFDRPAAVVVKHTNPCGVAVGRRRSPTRTARPARPTPLSAFGGIVALQPRGGRGDRARPRGDVPRVRRGAVVRARGARAAPGQEEPAPAGDRGVARPRTTPR